MSKRIKGINDIIMNDMNGFIIKNCNQKTLIKEKSFQLTL